MRAIMTVPALLAETLEICAEKKALFQGDQSISFEDLHFHALSTAHHLRDLGIGKGDRVGVCMGKGIDQAICILGAMYANAVFVPVLPKLKHANIEHIILDSGMKALFTDATRLEEVKDFAGRTKLLIGAGPTLEDFPCFPYLRKHFPCRDSFFDCIGMDNAAIIYSSGSTGRPKGIVISHRNLSDGARIVSAYTGTTRDDRIAGILSLNFDYGLNQLWQTIYKGASLYFHDLLFPKDFFEMLHGEKITSLPLMPVIMTRMFDQRFYSPNPAHGFSNLRFITSSGGNVSPRMIENLETAFPSARICLMYGLTEAFRSSFLPPEQIKVRPRSIGKAIPDVELYVLDNELNVCPPGVSGQLVHRGGCMSKGYWNQPEKSAECFREIPMFPGEKVLFSGDTVRADEEGYIYFIARGDSMIKTHGYRVSPTEIEEEAATHEKITAAVAFGVDNVDIGQDIVLAYETADQVELNEKLLLNFLKQLLPSYMAPRYLLHFTQFPSTGNDGKVDRVWIQAKSMELLGIAEVGR
jgi:acyl-CoA synthetase (AMP-forming)/AMP-acid ligase II